MLLTMFVTAKWRLGQRDDYGTGFESGRRVSGAGDGTRTDFAAAYAPYYIAVIGPAAVSIKGKDDLADKTIAVNRGTLEDTSLTAAAPASATIQRFENYNSVIQAFISGQTELMVVGNDVGAQVLARQDALKPGCCIVYPARRLVCEREIQDQVEQSHQSKKARPGNGEQEVVGRETLEHTQTGPHDVEGAVAIEKPLPAVAADDGAETEVAVAFLLARCAAWRQRTCFKGRLRHI